jgi:hypothetical protein
MFTKKDLSFGNAFSLIYKNDNPRSVVLIQDFFRHNLNKAV